MQATRWSNSWLRNLDLEKQMLRKLVLHEAKDLKCCQFNSLEPFPNMALKDGGHCKTPPQLCQWIQGDGVLHCLGGGQAHRVRNLDPRGGCLGLTSEATMLASRGHLPKPWIASIPQAHNITPRR